MSRQFNLNPKDTEHIVKSGTLKERIKIENGKVVKYVNVNGQWVKHDSNT